MVKQIMTITTKLSGGSGPSTTILSPQHPHQNKTNSTEIVHPTKKKPKKSTSTRRSESKQEVTKELNSRESEPEKFEKINVHDDDDDDDVEGTQWNTTTTESKAEKQADLTHSANVLSSKCSPESENTDETATGNAATILFANASTVTTAPLSYSTSIAVKTPNNMPITNRSAEELDGSHDSVNNVVKLINGEREKRNTLHKKNSSPKRNAKTKKRKRRTVTVIAIPTDRPETAVPFNQSINNGIMAPNNIPTTSKSMEKQLDGNKDSINNVVNSKKNNLTKDLKESSEPKNKSPISNGNVPKKTGKFQKVPVTAIQLPNSINMTATISNDVMDPNNMPITNKNMEKELDEKKDSIYNVVHSKKNDLIKDLKESSESRDKSPISSGIAPKKAGKCQKGPTSIQNNSVSPKNQSRKATVNKRGQYNTQERKLQQSIEDSIRNHPLSDLIKQQQEVIDHAYREIQDCKQQTQSFGNHSNNGCQSLVSDLTYSNGADSGLVTDHEDYLPRLYIEEIAWRLHNPQTPHCSQPYTFKELYDREINLEHQQQNAVKNKKYSKEDILHSLASIKSIPPAPPPPSPEIFPSTNYCKWSFDENTRVLHADFTPSSSNTSINVTDADKQFLLLMMERDDITVISTGLMNAINPQLWNKQYISSCVGDDVYHRFRSFKRVLKEQKEKNKKEEDHELVVTHEENDRWVKLSVKDFFRYLHQRQIVLENIRKRRLNAGVNPVNPVDENDDNSYRRTQEEIFEYEDRCKEKKERKQTLNCISEVLYMIDYDLGKLLPTLKEDFMANFGIKSVLPSGSNCMMNPVNAEARPFMGPNLYLTPPASFTHFHQDGHGTVDSGHACLAGYNEVIMLRRLTEGHKRHALFLLNGGTVEEALNNIDFDINQYDALYGRPHDDGYNGRPDWPSNDSIQKCKEMNYYPSVFILKPGQWVHINKGRLHAFRKLSPEKLPISDCHHYLRNKTIETEKLGLEEHICLSVAWDWMYKGLTSFGTNKEISSVLECARLNREELKQSLAIPQTCVVQMAKALVASHDCILHTLAQRNNSTHKIVGFQTQNISIKESGSKIFEIYAGLRGILPSLKYIVQSHKDAWNSKKRTRSKVHCVTIATIPNTWENPELSPVDPYGSSDFFCKLCYEELSNIYMHCDGCENLLKKDFNICVRCHSEGRFKVFHTMHTSHTAKLSNVNHTGHFTLSRQNACPCRGGVCKICKYCIHCSCKCHRSFTLNFRFMNIDDESKLLKKVENIVSLDWRGEETIRRLKQAGNKPSYTMDIHATEDTEFSKRKNSNEADMNFEVDDGASIKMTSSIDGLKAKELNQALLACGGLDDPQTFYDALPDSVNEDHLIHLFRNFQGIRKLKFPNKITVGFSPLELYIVGYFLRNGKKVENCHYLMPYRKLHSLLRAGRELKEKNIFDNSEFIRRSQASVSLLLKEIHPISDSEKCLPEIDRNQLDVPLKRHPGEKNQCENIKNLGAKINNHKNHYTILSEHPESDHDESSEFHTQLESEVITKQSVSNKRYSIPLEIRDYSKTLNVQTSCRFSDTNNPGNRVILDYHEWQEEPNHKIVKLYSQIDVFDQEICRMFHTTKPKHAYPALSLFSYIKYLNKDTLTNFVKQTKELEALSISSLLNILTSQFKRADVFHLYRNFHDEETIDGNYLDSIRYSHREVEILVYCIIENKDVSEYHYLIPYREQENLRQAIKTIKKSKVIDESSFKDNARVSVESILQWENKKITSGKQN